MRELNYERIEQSEGEPSLVLGGTVLITGEVPRKTSFEWGMRHHERFDPGCGRWVPDLEITEEQALVVNLRGRGAVVLTGCGHRGAVNSPATRCG